MSQVLTPMPEARQKPDFLSVDFNESPYIVIWETTRACDLACVHCRAEAIKTRNPNELSTEEAVALLEDVRGFGKPLFVLTGGDPIRRPDVYDLIRHGADLGLRMTMTPSGTPLMTEEVITKSKEAGLIRMAVSLDGSTKEIHDKFRRVDGSYDWTRNILRWCRERELSTQINTTITRFNIQDIDPLCDLMLELGISLWSVFFLVPTGRGEATDECSAEEYETVFEKLYELSKTAPFDIKSTAAPHYRRLVMQRRKAEAKNGDAPADGPKEKFLTRGIGFSMKDGVGRAAKSVNDANGFVFISHTGEVYPSGFLPLTGGNVRYRSIVDIYRNSPLFRQLRDFDQLTGKCGYCEYKGICGGGRARTWGMLGDPMASEPLCTYIPPAFQKAVRDGQEPPAYDYFVNKLEAMGYEGLKDLVPQP